jgi:hypothetical protein
MTEELNTGRLEIKCWRCQSVITGIDIKYSRFHGMLQCRRCGSFVGKWKPTEEG